MAVLKNENIINELSNLDGWKFSNNVISKDFEFNNFNAAISFVVNIALIAEKIQHHPDIQIYSWNKVKISCSTHSEGGVTEKDILLAKKINSI